MKMWLKCIYILSLSLQECTVFQGQKTKSHTLLDMSSTEVKLHTEDFQEFLNFVVDCNCSTVFHWTLLVHPVKCKSNMCLRMWITFLNIRGILFKGNNVCINFLCVYVLYYLMCYVLQKIHTKFAWWQKLHKLYRHLIPTAKTTVIKIGFVS